MSEANKTYGKGNWILVQDQDSKHTAGTTRIFLERKGAEFLPLPPHSPDLNPIENIWAVLKRQVAKAKPDSIEELEETIENQWSQIPSDTFSNNFISFHGRLIEVIGNEGNPIHY